jgi:hydrogenase maturation protease
MWSSGSARTALTSTPGNIVVFENPVLVIGVGNRLRGDDSASGEVVRRLREWGTQTGIDAREELCEPSDLLQAWQGRDAVVLIDTMCSGDPPGTIRRFEVSDEPLPARLRGSLSTHGFGLHEAIELGRALQRLPRRVIVFAVEGRHFEAGATASDEVAAAVAPLASAVLREAEELAKN